VIEAISHLLPDGGRRPLDAAEAWAVEEVLDAAMHWQAGALPWDEAAKITPLPCLDRHGRAIESATYARFLAMTSADADDPRRPALVALVDHLVRAQGATITRFGIISQEDLLESGIIVR
jgi:hypothetical protein